MSKQDRQGVRTPAELERKYAFGTVFQEQGMANARLQESLSRIGQSQSQANAQFTALTAQLRQDLTKQQRALDGLTQRVSQVERDTSGNTSAIGELRTALASANSKLEALQGKQNSLKGSVSELDRRITALEENKK